VFFNTVKLFKSHGWRQLSLSINKHGTFNLLRR
jgi:hypothetical protein